MISNDIQKLLNQQINAELWSSYLYLSMSLDAEVKGYPGISNWCYIQSHEENDHARILQKYMISQGCPIHLLPIEQVPNAWATPLELFRSVLKHEKMITQMIHDIVQRTLADRDYATYSRMMWFVDEQVEEEETAADLVQRFEKAFDAPCYFMQLDYDLQKRTYEPPTNKRKGNWYN